jgi:hypothetical protein
MTDYLALFRSMDDGEYDRVNSANTSIFGTYWY